MFQDGPQEMEFDIHKYLQLVGRRKWVIIAFTVLLTGAVAVGTHYQPRIYEARTSVLAGNEAPRLLNFSDPLPQDRFSDHAFLQTQGAILTSRTFLQGVVKRLIDQGFYGKVDPEAVERISRARTEGLKPRVRALFSPNSRVIQIVVRGRVPANLVRLADAIAEEYVHSNLRNKEEMADEAVKWLDSQLEEQKGKLDTAQRALQAYKEKENIVGDANNLLAASGVSRLQDDYLTTHFQRLEREARLNALKKSRRSSSGARTSPTATQELDREVQSAFQEQLKKDYVATQMQLKDLSQRYGPDHPDIVALKEKQERIRKQLEEVQTKEPQGTPEEPSVSPTRIEDLQADYNALLSKEKYLKNRLGARQAEARKLSRAAVQYSLLKEAVDQSQKIYNDLMKRRDEARLSSQLKSATVTILDRAVLPKIPVKPKPLQNLLLALILGPMTSIGLVILMDLLDRRVRTPQEASKLLQMPVLTVVPGTKRKRGHAEQRERKGAREKGEGRMRLVTLQEPRSHPAECYRNLRTSILFSSGRPVPRSILVTSAIAGEGKSTTAANLAVVMAQSGRKTVLIDADLRRPALHRYFPREPKRGILRLLTDEIPVEQAVQDSGVPNLSLLLCNSVPRNPSELLGSERARKVLEELSEKFDVTIIDSPVVISVPDALILASRAAAAILVHRPGASQRELVRHAREKLDEVKANILGLVLNHVDLKSARYFYPEYTYYGYGVEETGAARKHGKGKR